MAIFQGDLMRASISRQSKNSFTIRFDLPRGADGRRKQKRITLKGSRHDAERRAAQIVNEVETDQFSDPGKVTVSAFLTEWLGIKKRTLESKTWTRYASIVEIHLKPKLGARKLRDLRAADIEHAIREWTTGDRKDLKKGKLRGTSVHHHFCVLRTALNCAVKWRKIQQNPCKFVDCPKRDDREMVALNVEGVYALLAAIQDVALQLLILVAIGAGMRRGELLGARWQDVDFEERTIFVRRALERLPGGQLHFKVPKSKKARRKICLPEFALAALRMQRDLQVKRFNDLGIAPPNGDTVIFDDLGAPRDPENFSSIYYRAVKKAALPSIRLHDLRHSFATLMLSSGTNLKVASDALGHAQISITGNRYVHPDMEQHQQAADKLDAKLRTSKRASLPSPFPIDMSPGSP